jgi:hypothetical protein
VESYAKAFEGESRWLKIDLVEVHYGLRGIDAVNILESGRVVYAGSTGDAMAQSQMGTSAEFIAKARLGGTGAVRILERGSLVVIESVKFERGKELKSKVAHIRLKKQDGVGHSVRLQFSDADAITPEDFHRLLSVAFAESEEDYEESLSTRISLGMDVSSVIERLGSPKVRVEMSSNEMFFYDWGLKLTFENEKLIDAE